MVDDGLAQRGEGFLQSERHRAQGGDLRAQLGDSRGWLFHGGTAGLSALTFLGDLAGAPALFDGEG